MVEEAEPSRTGVMSETLLQIDGLHTHFKTKEGTVKAVNGVSLTLRADSVLGVVGESGARKTMTALSILRLVPFPGEIVAGSITYMGRDLLNLDREDMRHIRGNDISLIFQDAGAALNPVIHVGRQVEEIMLEHTDMSQRQARSLANDLLTQMGIPDAKQTLERYPFQLSGGMSQRVMMAIGVALKPKVFLADEPTSNLDVTLQAEMLHRLSELRRETRSAIMLITHDLGIIAQMAEEVAVMYGETVVEYSDTKTLLQEPLHPYTWGLMQAVPRVDMPTQRLMPMRGTPPRMVDPPGQCPLLKRCHKEEVPQSDFRVSHEPSVQTDSR